MFVDLDKKIIQETKEFRRLRKVEFFYSTKQKIQQCSIHVIESETENQFDNENKTYLIMMYCLKSVESWKADKEILLCDQLVFENKRVNFS